MDRVPSTRIDSPVARLGAFTVILLAALGGGLALGAAVGSGNAEPTPPSDPASSTTTVPAPDTAHGVH